MKILDVINNDVVIPDQITTYWCKLLELPDDVREKQHIIRHESHIQPGNEDYVHHIEVFHCQVNANQELPDWNGSCFDENMPEILKKCKKVLSAWAMGAEVSAVRQNCIRAVNPFVI